MVKSNKSSQSKVVNIVNDAGGAGTQISAVKIVVKARNTSYRGSAFSWVSRDFCVVIFKGNGLPSGPTKLVPSWACFSAASSISTSPSAFQLELSCSEMTSCGR